MRSVWIDAGSDPYYSVLAKHGIGACYFDAREPRLTSDYLDRVAGHGITPGIYVCWNWGDLPQDPKGLALWTHKRLLEIGWRGNPPVYFNSENDSGAWLAALLKRWRELRPTRKTFWSPQAHKANVYAAVVPQIVASGVTLGPQCYLGSMQRVESAEEVQSWVGVGIPPERIEPMLDAAQLGGFWGEPYGACAFTQGRLPQ